MSTGAAGHVPESQTQSTRNIINITTNRIPFVNLTTNTTTPIIAAASATATSLLSSAATVTATNGSSSMFQKQRLSQMSTGTTVPTRQLTTIPTQQQGRTTATIIMNSKRPTIIIYPTVSPESIVIPIVSCILGFPLLALLVICCLRRRAKLARERDRRRNYDMQDHAVSLVRFSPIHRLNNRSARVISLRPERSLSRGFPSLELDTVIEERSDAEQTQTDILSPESPLDPQKYRDFNSS